MCQVEFVTSKGTTLLLNRNFIETNTDDRNQVTGERVITKSGLMIDRISSGYDLVIDLDYTINAFLHAKYYIDEDVTKAFKLKFVDRVDGSIATINEALKAVSYTGVLPITDLNDTFMKMVSFNATKIGISQTGNYTNKSLRRNMKRGKTSC